MARKKKAKNAYRSKFEASLGDRLDREGVKFGYETETFRITVDVKGVHCGECGASHALRNTRFTPDFFFKNWTIEAKGKFTANDRKRIKALIMAHPGRRFAMLFMRDNKLSKSSETRYSTWCEQQGIPWAVGWFKPEWLR